MKSAFPRLMASLVLALTTAASLTAPAQAYNTVSIESKTASPNSSITIGVSLQNDAALQGLFVPLVIRSSLGLAYPSSITGYYPSGSRLSGHLNQLVFIRGYDIEDGTCKEGQPGGFATEEGSTMNETTPYSLDSPDDPDALDFARFLIVDGQLPPGDDPPGVPSIAIDVNVGPVSGSFIIDTTCTYPDGHLKFTLMDNSPAPNLSFAMGTVFVFEQSEGLCFQAAPAYRTGVGPHSICTGNFYTNTFADLAIVNQNANTVSLCLSLGDGRYGYKQDWSVGSLPRSVCTANLDGIAPPDLAVANSNSDNVSVLINQGFATFQPAVNYAVGDDPRCISTVYWGGDAYPDLVTANVASDNISVLINNGDGTFQAPLTFTMGDGPIAVCAADFYGDSFDELAVANYWDGTVKVVKRFGPNLLVGTFAAGSLPRDLCAADLDGVHGIDIAVANEGGEDVTVLLNLGNGSFAPAVSYPGLGSDARSIAAADMNLDGALDLVVTFLASDDIYVFVNAGDGTFPTSVRYPTGDGANAVCAADFNGDNAADLAVANFYDNNFLVMLNCSTGPCDCPHQADYDDDNFLTALDLGELIDVLFAGSPEITDPQCSTSRGDFNCDQFPTSLDLGGLIDHLFAGGAGPCNPCAK